MTPEARRIGWSLGSGSEAGASATGSVAEGLREIGRAVVDDLEAILADLPPSAMQQAQPELIRRR